MEKKIKDFDKWNKKKKEINYNIKNILPGKRQVWWLSIGLNIGVEEDGKNNNFERPVLVIKVFNRQCFLGIPITSANKSDKKYYFPIIYNQNKYFLILSQIRLFSVKRLSRKIYKISSVDFTKIKKELERVIGLN
ncbi:MAG: type II toxin-antitoxin system PemK/MazF family toxin [Patescibacteria group bacterium]|nr:type II toxin-antitoxin system PemK/MazF family toxin [Patescibacteria group bacterium]